MKSVPKYIISNYNIIDQDGKILKLSFYNSSMKFVSDCVVFYERRKSCSRQLEIYEIGYLNVELDKIIYSFEMTVYRDHGYSGFGYLCSYFHDGLLQLSEKNKIFFIDENGIIKFEISNEFEIKGEFSEGLVSCQDNYTEYYIFDYQTHKIELLNSIIVDYLKPRFNKEDKIHKSKSYFAKTESDLIPFQNIHIPLNLPKDNWMFFVENLWGYKNNKGETIIEPKFYEARAFNNGIAIVEDYMDKIFIRKDEDKKRYKLKKYGYIDIKGNYIINPKFSEAYDFYQELAFVRCNDVTGLINQNGEVICTLQFHDTISIGDERFLIFTKRKIGFLDKEGKWQIKPSFESVCSFENGKCYVMENGLWGQIDKNGEWLIKPNFENLWDCEDYFNLNHIINE